jgi:hypothetical protein
LNGFPGEFEEGELVDVEALKRQVGSFERMWRVADGREKKDFGIIEPREG